MKGIVFNLLEEVVVQAHGEETWDKLIEGAGASGSYTALGSYDDAELFKIVGAASKALNTPAADIVRWFGAQAASKFAERYPHFFQKHKETRSFLLTLNDIIHPEVRKLYPGASVPEFEFKELPDGGLQIKYDSAKKLCALAEGLVEGSAAYFGQSAKIEQTQCMQRGDSSCVLVCTFKKK